MLSSRQILVLKAIIEEYVKTNEPVGSRTLSKREELAFSPATLRNDMADLEDLGYLEKTHTSSGRIPSIKGYHYYVETLMNEKDKLDYSFPMIDEIFNRRDLSKEQAINESMNLVSQLTNYASLVLGSSASSQRIKKLQFVGLQERFALILMITDAGHVESKKIIVPEELSFGEIDKVVRILDEILKDSIVSEIQDTLEEKLNNEEILELVTYREDLVKAIVQAFQEMATDKYHISGQANILSQPEFQDIEKVKDLFYAIEQKEILKVIKYDESGISVRIGDENEIRALRDCTVITVPYATSTGEKGAISLFGPTRMEYSKIIPLLEYISKNINKIL